MRLAGFLLASFTSGAWVDTNVLNRFCVVKSGIEDAVCVDRHCVTPGGEQLSLTCSEYDLERSAGNFEDLRGQLVRRAVTAVMPRFDFSAQVYAANYSEFLAFRNKPRFTRAVVPGSLATHFGNSTVAIRRLLEMFTNVPGADWLQGVYEPHMVTSPDETLERLLIPSEAPFERFFAEKLLIRGLPIPQEVVSDFLRFNGFDELERKLLALWATTTARSVVRLKDSEHRDYGKRITDALVAIDEVINSVPEQDLPKRIPVDLMEWLYDLVTASSPLLLPPLVRNRVAEGIERSNHASPVMPELITAEEWFMAPLMAASPQFDWADPVTEEAFLQACTMFGEETDSRLPPAKRTIGLRVLHRIASLRGFNTTSVFNLIPPQWRDFAVSFDPQPHHFLDGLSTVMSVLAVARTATPDNMVAIAKLARDLRLVALEIESAPLRTSLEYRVMLLPALFFDIGLHSSSSGAAVDASATDSMETVKGTILRTYTERMHRLSGSISHTALTVTETAEDADAAAEFMSGEFFDGGDHDHDDDD